MILKKDFFYIIHTNIKRAFYIVYIAKNLIWDIDVTEISVTSKEDNVKVGNFHSVE